MKIRRITIAGVRGFNDECTIDFDEKLTIIAAKNSHGKTSISEALELLLYDSTSKVDKADSREEYQDSYRNRHYPQDRAAFVEAVFFQEGWPDSTWRLELLPDGGTRKLLDGTEVDQWPSQNERDNAPRPFVLQHALKYLLLVAPVERFAGFAKLIGLNNVERSFDAILGLCTKPKASLPAAALVLMEKADSQIGALKSNPQFRGVAKLLESQSDREAAYADLEARADKIIGGESGPEDRIGELRRMREDASKRVYSRTTTIRTLRHDEQSSLDSSTTALRASITGQFLADYGELATIKVAANLEQNAQFLEIGNKLLEANPEYCPFCNQPITDTAHSHIRQLHEKSKDGVIQGANRSSLRSRIQAVLIGVRNEMKAHAVILTAQCDAIATRLEQDDEDKLRELIGSSHEALIETIRSCAARGAAAVDELLQKKTAVEKALNSCGNATEEGGVRLEQAEDLGQALSDYLEASAALGTQIVDARAALAEPARVVREAVDARAGTIELSIVLELLENRGAIEKGLWLRDLLDGLKTLRKNAEHILGMVMETTMSAALTDSVMEWYSRIKTTGDPDVHFTGFEVDRKADGSFHGRRVGVKAASYGVPLASAVSSLSESKLNALGLCISIASALRTPELWQFLVIDDPIQSWDDEHETQFIEVLRELATKRNKQLIVLTHKNAWAKRVCDGCRTVNGIHYELTGYSKEGPHLKELLWATVTERIKEAEGIAGSKEATSVRLQQAEEEVRLAACQLAADIAWRSLKRETSSHKLNGSSVRGILTEAGYDGATTDRIIAMFHASDDAHHAPKDYEPSRERIRQACSSLRDVQRRLEESTTRA